MAAKGTRAAALSAVPSPEQLERERRCLELRQAGVDFATIAEQVGYTHKGSAKRAYDRALARVHYPSAMEARELELTRLDRLQRAHWVKALQGDDKATAQVLRIIDMRVKLLGLSHADGLAERAARVNELQAALLALATAPSRSLSFWLSTTSGTRTTRRRSLRSATHGAGSTRSLMQSRTLTLRSTTSVLSSTRASTL